VPPVLLVCAHGTRSAAGAAQVSALVDEVAARRPGLAVRAAYVDVQQPHLPTALAALDGSEVVVVPLLLSAGFHVHVDIRQAVQAAGDRVRAAGALGPDPALVTVLAERLAAAITPVGGAGSGGGTGGGAVRADHVVVAAAGSSDAQAVADVERTGRDLAAALGVPVGAGYLSAAAPTVAEAVAAARTAGARTVAIATYLLAPGFFADRLAEAGADLVTAPLLPHPALADLVLRRYDETAAG
jgi:sirohydrochlorin ferrochelatase